MEKQKIRNSTSSTRKPRYSLKTKYIISKSISKTSGSVINPVSHEKYRSVTTNTKKTVLDSKVKYIISKQLSKTSDVESSSRNETLKSNDEENIFGRIKEPVKFTQKRRFNPGSGSIEKLPSKSLTNNSKFAQTTINTNRGSASIRHVNNVGGIEKDKQLKIQPNSKISYVAKKNNLHKKNYLRNKAMDKIDEEQNYDNIDDLSIKSGLYMRKGFISCKSAIINTKKVYYVVRNLNPERRRQTKSAYLSKSNINEIKQKRHNVYKHYTVKNLLAEKVENQIIKNAKVNYNYTGDTSVESAKMAIEKTYDTVRAVKSITNKIKKVNRIIKTIKAKPETKVNITNKNKMKQNMAKNKYIKDKKRNDAIIRASSDFSKNIIRKSYLNLRNPQVLKFTAIKLIVPLSVILIMFMIMSLISSGGVVITSSYKIIGAEKKIIKEYKNYVSRLDSELKEKVEEMSKSESGNYDDVVIDIYGENGNIDTNFKEILVLNTVFFEQNIKFTQEEVNKINSWHKKMNKISKKTERYHCSGCETRHCSSKNCSGHRYCPGHTRLRIIVNCLSMEDILDSIEFTDFQKDWARELMLCDLENLYSGEGFEVDGGLSGLSGLTPIEIAEILSGLPETGVRRSEIIKSAVSLVGKVPYFWGGKSAPGWNDKWNKPQLVTAPGTSDSGTVIPYGLDCSGFVDWAYKTAGVGNVLSAGGTAYQWNQSYGINKKDAKPGDLVFKNPPNSNGINHIGIYLGKDSSGRDRFVHCSYSDGVTIDSWSGFKYFRRVKVKLDD